MLNERECPYAPQSKKLYLYCAIHAMKIFEQFYLKQEVWY